MSVQSTSRPVSPATIVSEATHTAHELSKEKEQDPSDFEVKFDENDPENPQVRTCRLSSTFPHQPSQYTLYSTF